MQRGARGGGLNHASIGRHYHTIQLHRQSTKWQPTTMQTWKKDFLTCSHGLQPMICLGSQLPPQHCPVPAEALETIAYFAHGKICFSEAASFKWAPCLQRGTSLRSWKELLGTYPSGQGWTPRCGRRTSGAPWSSP